MPNVMEEFNRYPIGHEKVKRLLAPDIFLRDGAAFLEYTDQNTRTYRKVQEKNKKEVLNLKKHIIQEKNAYKQMCVNLESEIERLDGKIKDQKVLNQKIESEETFQRLVDTNVLIQAIRKVIISCNLQHRVQHLATDLDMFEIGDGLDRLYVEAEEYLERNNINLQDSPEQHSRALPGMSLNPRASNPRRGDSKIGAGVKKGLKEEKEHIKNVDYAKMGIPALADAIASCNFNLSSERYHEEQHRKQKEKMESPLYDEDFRRDLDDEWELLQLRQFFRYLERLAEPDREFAKLEERLTNLKYQTVADMPDSHYYEEWKAKEDLKVEAELHRVINVLCIKPIEEDDSDRAPSDQTSSDEEEEEEDVVEGSEL